MLYVCKIINSTDYVWNKEVRKRIGIEGSVGLNICKGMLRYFGYIENNAGPDNDETDVQGENGCI